MCKYLKGEGKDWYKCALSKKRCPYQRYCTLQQRFVTDGCTKCPAHKEQKTEKHE